MTYFDELRSAMKMLAQEPRSIFMGQAVACQGTAMSRTFEGLPADKLLEMPVAEDMQMGMAVGMSLAGDLPVCVYPRWSFLLLATNQLVLHLDKLPLYSAYRPKVIIRTAVPTNDPLDPGPQHMGDFTFAFRQMLYMVEVVDLNDAGKIGPEYFRALRRERSTLLVERTELYA